MLILRASQKQKPLDSSLNIQIVSCHFYLSKRALPNQRVNLIAVQPFLSIFNNVVVIIIIVAIVEDFSLLLGTAVLGWDLLRPPLLFSIIHLSRRQRARERGGERKIPNK